MEHGGASAGEADGAEDVEDGRAEELAVEGLWVCCCGSGCGGGHDELCVERNLRWEVARRVRGCNCHCSVQIRYLDILTDVEVRAPQDLQWWAFLISD